MLFIETWLGNPWTLILTIALVFVFRKRIGAFFGKITSGKTGHSESTPQLKLNRSDEGVAQWIYPSKLLSTPQSAFDFPEYPGLSVAMRLYIVVGKISWWLALLILVGFNIFYAVFTVGLGLLLTLPVSFLILLLMNLGLAFQFGSCEIVKVLIRNEENTRTVKKLLEKQLQTEDENKEE